MIMNCKSKLQNGQKIELFIDMDKVVAIYKGATIDEIITNDRINKNGQYDKALLFVVLPTREIPIFDEDTANAMILYFDTQDDICSKVD